MLYISLRQYEYVCAIGRYGSLSTAAQHLNVSQPALSTALTRIEEHLGHPLFSRRRGSAMAVTPQGRQFIEQAELLLASAAQLENSDRPHLGTERLQLGCFVDLAPFLLAPALHQLRKVIPNVTVSYRADRFEALLTALIKGQIDLAITYDLGMDAGFTRRPLFVSKPNAIMSPDHPLSRAGQVSLADLTEYPLILSEEGLSAQHILGLFRRSGLTPQVNHRAASLEILRSLAAHNEGVGLSYADPPARRSYDGKPIVSLPVSDPEASEAVVLARHGTGPVTAEIAAAEAALIRIFKTE